MPRLFTALVALIIAGAAASLAGAASVGRPPGGHYRFGHGTGFTVNKRQTSISKFSLEFTVGTGTTDECDTAKLKAGTIIASIRKPLKITAARRGGYTAYIIGRSTPKTSNGITAMPETFRLSSGGTVKGTMYLVFNFDHPTSGDGTITIADCTLPRSFTKG